MSFLFPMRPSVPRMLPATPDDYMVPGKRRVDGRAPDANLEIAVSNPIHSQDLQVDPTSSLTTSIATQVLQGEIGGLDTIFHAVGPGQTVQLQHSPDQGRVYLFTRGNGGASCGTETHQVAEVALWAPRHATSHSVTAADTSLHFLELVVDLSATDLAELEQSADKLPLFISYSDCRRYSERIKSAKTISRTLLPEHTFPRLCVGSVETTGDDSVVAHEHPMLEQLFLGLQSNACMVHADDAEFFFGQDVLLHIPLGSRHGVDVQAPDKLHYVWIDLFKNREGMQWIVQEHIPEA